LNAIHEAAVGLGADCNTANKSEVANDLNKIDSDVLAKALETALEPLNKALHDANEKIAKLEALPATPRVSLRAVSKADDTGETSANQVTEADLVKDDHGVLHPAASLIKQAQATGGSPLYRG